MLKEPVQFNKKYKSKSGKVYERFEFNHNPIQREVFPFRGFYKCYRCPEMHSDTFTEYGEYYNSKSSEHDLIELEKDHSIAFEVFDEKNIVNQSKKTYLKLENGRNGGVKLAAVNNKGEILSYLLFIDKDGFLGLFNSIGSATGFKLDSDGKLKLKD